MSTEAITAVLTEIRRLDTQLKANGDGGDQNSANVDFSELLAQALAAVNQSQQDSAQARTAYTVGDEGYTLADVMIAQQKARLSFEATLRIRNHVVSAYQEIMNMPI